ncbi:MutS family DNA mismatch repair protein [Rhodopirellula sp. JC740]|uniref:MutS family DNA mismatch repair protein n=1 Tax=Rhodopirellula halodulae TaxID=2894198 RepID=A0ABS8NH91_9BACT|nr:MutS family DNA mismatch repair protein [Rhodopirellula sp. JC740]MCC9641846.1 MutS family DNA mismatch repair protein [Rhodopirellula sp. JC740]
MSDYASQIETIDRDLHELEATDGRFAIWRMVFFVGLVLGVGFAITTQHVIWASIAGGSLLAFLVTVVRNETVRDRMELLRNQSRTLHRLQARLDRDWQSLARDGVGVRSQEIQLTDEQQALAGDLDLVGEASLFQLTSMAATTPGVRTLANWLCSPVDPPIAIDRHASVKHLADQPDNRLRFYVLARDIGGSSGDPESFVKWSKEPNWLPPHRWLIPWGNFTALLAVAITIAMVVGQMTDHADWLRLGLYALIGIAVINLAIGSFFLGPVAAIFQIAMASRRSVNDYAELFDAARWLPETTDNANGPTSRIRSALLADEGSSGSASQGMRELAKVARMGGLKQTASTFLLYLPLQAFWLWDVRVLRRLEEWKSRYSDQIPTWFDALGELEALMSIAALQHDAEGWISPEWLDDQSTLTFEGLGHPLLKDHVRVTNDVTIGPEGTLLLVTGSNMSGKSTMLRSAGLNVALAMAGGPVCCRRMSLPPIEMGTSIRVSDDLSQGVSYYMAELNRLSAVVAHARELSKRRDGGDTKRIQFFLLDEILQGTNSRERQIAVARVLRFLVEAGAVGAITTHDLELADDEELMRMAHTVHFRETVTPDASGDERMTFDYKMREGVSPTTNALRLLEIVGLGEQ